MKNILIFALLGLLAVSTANAQLTVAQMKDLLAKATKFYGAQRCGNANNWLIANIADGHTCHLQDGPGYTANPNIDLTGGWHDAGDHLKFTLTNAYASYVLLKAYDAFPAAFADNYSPSYGPADGIPDVLNEVKVGTDYLLKLQLSSTVMIAQVGDGNADHNVFFTSPLQSTKSTSQGGGARAVTDGAQGDYQALTAAALALMSIHYKSYDSTYASTCLQKAISLYTMSKNYPGPTNNQYYPQSNSQAYIFDMIAAGAEIYRAYGVASYLNDAVTYEGQVGPTGWVASWANQADFARHSLWKAGSNAGMSDWANDVNNYLTKISTNSQVSGLAYFTDWGTNRYAMGAAFSAMLYWQATGSPANSQYVTFAMGQLNWIAGTSSANHYNRSFVIGFGNNPPVNPAHRNSYGKDQFPQNADFNDHNLNSLVGGLVGGPNANAQGSFPAGYEDVTSDYSENEVALDYNAGLVGMAAAAVVYSGGGQAITTTVAPTNAPTNSPSSASTSAPTQASTQAPTQAPTQASTQAPTSAPTQSTGTTTGTIVITVSASSAFSPQCNNGVWALFGQGLFLSVTVTQNGQSFTNQPMAETIQDSVTGNFAVINMAWFINGQAAPVSVSNTFNVGSSTTSGNVWSFALEDDQPNIGGTIMLGSCTQGATAPSITASFSCNTFINGVGTIAEGQGNIPAVSALPTVVNGLNAANIASTTATLTTAPIGEGAPKSEIASTASNSISVNTWVTIGLLIGIVMAIMAY
jgi:endoglucanase